jgi:UDP-N-acetylmuramate dehydrogenase
MDRFAQLRDLLARRCPALELREQESMARHTTFRLGGPARLMALPSTAAQAALAVSAARELEIVPFFLGNGSNLLVADEGYLGFIIKLQGELNQVREVSGRLEAGGSVLLSRLANAALDRGLTGLEFAGGIPGSVGGGVTMNAGAYGGELAQVVESVTVLEPDGTTDVLLGTECGFGYRKSIFSGGERLILGASFALEPGDRTAIAARMEELSQQRRSKQPLEYPSAGSMFKRPAGHFAAALIDQCGLKGFAVGGAQVSEKHAGFVVNRGGATCGDVLSLVEQVRARVLEQTGVELEMEVKVLK